MADPVERRWARGQDVSARRMAEVYDRARRELLAVFVADERHQDPTTSLTAQHRLAMLQQMAPILDQLQREAGDTLQARVDHGLADGHRTAHGEARRVDPGAGIGLARLNPELVAFHRERSSTLIAAVDDDLRHRIRLELAVAQAQGLPLRDVSERILGTGLTLEGLRPNPRTGAPIYKTVADRARAIARTEYAWATNNAYHATLVEAARGGANVGKGWSATLDGITSKRCKALHAKYHDHPIPLDEAFVAPDGWRGGIAPAHPNCRSRVRAAKLDPEAARAQTRRLQELTVAKAQTKMADAPATTFELRPAPAGQATVPPPAAGPTEAERILGTRESKSPIGGQRSLSGRWTGTDGIQRYVRDYGPGTQAESDALTTALQQRLGVPVAPTRVVRHQGRPLAVAELAPGTRAVTLDSLSEAQARQLADGVGVDMLLANWDAPGRQLRHLAQLPDGTVIRTANPGGLLYRPGGGRKASRALRSVSEWDGFWDSQTSPEYAAILQRAGYTSPEAMGQHLVRQLRAIEQQGAAGWGSLVDTLAPTMSPGERADVTAMLEARTAQLSRHRAALERQLARQGEAQAAGTLALEDSPELAAWNKGLDGLDARQLGALYRNLYGSDTLRRAGAEFAAEWSAGYSYQAHQTAIREAWDHLAAGGEVTTELQRKVLDLVATRAERWQRLADRLGIDRPEAFTLRRGISSRRAAGRQAIVAAVRAWATGTPIATPAATLSSWSMGTAAPEFFAGKGGLGMVVEAEIPFGRTIADKWADDGNLVTKWGWQDEVVVYTPADTPAVLDPTRVRIRYAGRWWTHDERDELLAAWRADPDAPALED